ncbi:zinc finger protein ZFAT-like [Polyodon spathula]|uniref:zinc finger protein ZFAT-like n=1 Tax=Polyodon spathula TaxID=7913 RepID=UPI001B7EDD2F|nr:zinc finger protein ZFAT-like [Polyodon spathula]
MDSQTADAVSIFMCKACNLFSPSRTELLTHVSEQHTVESLCPDDIIVALRPLSTTGQSEKSGAECVLKRKRGRPKGSTKKYCVEEELVDASASQREEAKPEKEQEKKGPESGDPSGVLECRKCSRRFCNTRQLKKHICIMGLKEEVEEEDENDPGIKSASDGKYEDRGRPPKRSRIQSTEKASVSKDCEQPSGAKKPIISMVLTAHEAVPGATKIIPIEAPHAESATAMDPESSGQDEGLKRGYQEYAIQQMSSELPMKSNRLAQTQLKIFTCEYCNKVFKFKHSLQAHLRIHTNEKPFKCPHCDYASTIKANLSVHLRKHTGEKFSCQHCDFSCLSKGHLKVHVERVHKKIKQHCRFCNKKYSDVKNLLKHVRESHDMEDRKVKDCYEEISLQTREGKRQLLYDCHTCDRKFKNQLDRDRHMMVHGDERPYGCELCDHGATKYQALEVHIRKHPFIYLCTVCQHKFVSSVRLRSHIKEAHANLAETTVFSDSINQSFCLLEPGGDIQPDALKERELQMTEELSLLNEQHALVAELGNTEEVTTEQCVHGVAVDNLEGDFPTQDAALTDMVENQQFQVHSAEDSQSHETTVLDKGDGKVECSEDSQIHKTTVLDKGDEKVECPEDSQSHETTVLDRGYDKKECSKDSQSHKTTVLDKGDDKVKCSEGSQSHKTTVLDKGDDKVECSEGFQQETDKQPLQAADQELVEICTTVEHTTDVIQQETLNQSSVPSQENLMDTHQPNVATQLEKTLSNKETESGAGNTETTEALGVTMESNLPSSGKNTLTADTQEESTAFKKIMDSLQKRQLNMDLFERIRKVYGDLECEYCGKLFWYQVHYDMHTRTHTHEHLYYCSQCSYSSITKNCLKRHVIQKHSNILLKCPTKGCEYTTPDKYKLQAHLKIHSELDKRSYVCPVCEKSFPEDRLIKSHIKNSHPEVSMNTISEILGRRVQLKGLIGKRASKCPYCDCYLMRNGSDLQRHIWAHEGVKPFKCSLCDYATRSKSNLKAHMNRHSTEKPHLCDMCGKKFKSRSSLKSHKLQHAADGRQFKCTVCDFTAVQKPQLLRHMEQHASFKPFRCAHCHYSCNMSGSLKRHYNKKHPSKEYVNAGVGPPAADMLIQQGGVKCPVCNFVYGTKWEMNRHLKNKHGLKLVEIEGDAKREHVVESSVEESSTQYLHITETEDLQGTEAAVAALQDLRYNTENADRLDPTAVNILQQIIELGTESHGASVVAMAPGTVTVVEREQQGNHAVMIQEALQQASVGLCEEHHLVVSSDDMEGIETVTVYTQGEDASEFIVYVQEAVQAEEEQTVGPV